MPNYTPTSDELLELVTPPHDRPTPTPDRSTPTPDPTPREMPAPREKPTPTRDRRHILLIEDDDQMRSMLTQSLEKEGYRVTECPDAMHWMDFCMGEYMEGDSTEYDLVVSDIRLPGVTGLEVLEGLKRSHRNPPTILITAFGDEQTHRRAKELGAREVLDKPFATQMLLKMIREQIGQSAGRGADTAADDEPTTDRPIAPDQPT